MVHVFPGLSAAQECRAAAFPSLVLQLLGASLLPDELSLNIYLYNYSHVKRGQVPFIILLDIIPIFPNEKSKC